MSWRPDDWWKYSNEQPATGSPNHESFEAGADAYEAALKEKGIYRKAITFSTGKVSIPAGWEVFIPEEES